MENKCNCPCHQEEVKEDTKKECRHENYKTLCGGKEKYCSYCCEYLGSVEPPKEPVKNPTFLVYDIYGEGATATKVLNMRRSLEVIAKYLDETQ